MGLAPDLKGGFNSDQPYSLLLNTMAAQGVIASRVFSLDLRHSDQEKGAVIYGGLDRTKYIGDLEQLPIVRGSHGEYRLAVELSTVGVTFDGQSDDFQVSKDDANVMLDSGTTISRMHEAAAKPILKALHASQNLQGYYYTSCQSRKASGSIDFGFGSKIIRVPLSDFILDVGDPDVCYIGLVITTDQQILGDSVLRAGYFVFDWDNEAVHVAQAADCGDGDIVAVGKGENAVPSVKGHCKGNDSTNEATAKALVSTRRRPTGTNTRPPCHFTNFACNRRVCPPQPTPLMTALR